MTTDKGKELICSIPYEVGHIGNGGYDGSINNEYIRYNPILKLKDVASTSWFYQ